MLQQLKENVSKKGISMIEAEKAVCVPLAKKIEIGYVLPDSWQKFELCRRQMSWYGVSSFNGLILVVSSYELSDYGLKPETVIIESKFKPVDFPDDRGMQELISQKSYQQSKPLEWENIAAKDTSLTDKWLKLMGIRKLSYEELFVYHCANHANFIEPKYYIEGKYGPIPYSINKKSSYICSACLEFYNIIGSSYEKKMVVPCPGAALYAGLPVNRYMEVTNMNIKG